MVKKYFSKKPNPIPFTRKAYSKMQQDQKDLQKERGEILIRLQTAREMGDLSENGAYTAAKFELGGTDRKLRQLAYQLKVGVITESKNDNTVDFGSKVTLKINDTETSFLLVSDRESDPKQNKLSIQSPIGQAVLGKKLGDKVTVLAPAGKTTYTISKLN